MKVDTTNRSIMLFEAVNDGTNAIVPTTMMERRVEKTNSFSTTRVKSHATDLQLDDSIVQGSTHPGSHWMKGQALHTG